MCLITTASAPHAHVLLAAGVHALHEEELGEALPRELVDLLAVRLHLVGDEQRLEAARRRDRLEERVGRRVLLGPRLLALALALLRLDLLLEQEVRLWQRRRGRARERGARVRGTLGDATAELAKATEKVDKISIDYETSRSTSPSTSFRPNKSL